jgi:hypothetical protein
MPLLTELGKLWAEVLPRCHAYGVAETSRVRQTRSFENKQVYTIAEKFCPVPDTAGTNITIDELTEKL